jgi:hypothetical protein
MLAKKFASLLNGGAAVAGIDGLIAEIETLSDQMNAYRRELGAMPARRAELILTDDPDAALDALEMRERELYRKLEKGDLQTAGIEARLTEIRRAAIKPLIDRHRSALMAVSGKVEAAVLAAMAANAEAASAFADAVAELGQDDANRLMPIVGFAGFLNDEGLEIWRWKLNEQNERIARQHGGAGL